MDTEGCIRKRQREIDGYRRVHQEETEGGRLDKEGCNRRQREIRR